MFVHWCQCKIYFSSFTVFDFYYIDGSYSWKACLVYINIGKINVSSEMLTDIRLE